MRRVQWLMFGFWSLWFLIGLATLSGYPVISFNPDEAWLADVAWNFMRTGVVKTSMFPGAVINQTGYGALSFQAYAGIMALCFKTLGVNPFAARLPSLAGGLLMMVSAYLIGTRLWSRAVGVWASVLMGSTASLFIISHTARPETLIAGLAGLAFYFVLTAKPGSWPGPVLAGLIMGFLPWFHLVGGFLFLALALFLASQSRWRDLAGFVAGTLPGYLLFLFVNVIPHWNSALFSDVHSSYWDAFPLALMLHDPAQALHLFLRNLIFRNVLSITGTLGDAHTLYLLSSIVGAGALLSMVYHWKTDQRGPVILILWLGFCLALMPRGTMPLFSYLSTAVLFFPLLFPLFVALVMRLSGNSKFVLVAGLFLVGPEILRLSFQVHKDSQANRVLSAAAQDLMSPQDTAFAVDKTFWWWFAPGRVRVMNGFWQPSSMVVLSTKTEPDSCLIMVRWQKVNTIFPRQPWQQESLLIRYEPR